MDSIDVPSDISFQLWYLDEGIFARTRSAVGAVGTFCTHGPFFALTLNLKKYEVFALVELLPFGIFLLRLSFSLQVSDSEGLLRAPILEVPNVIMILLLLSLTELNICRIYWLSKRS